MDELRERVDRFLTKVGIHLQGEAVLALESDPRRVDTGLLRNSITYALGGEKPAITTYTANAIDTWEKTKKPKDIAKKQFMGTYEGTAPRDWFGSRSVYVGTNVEYAPYVHEGTSRMAPNRFIKNAFEWNMEQIKQKAEEEGFITK